MKILVGADPEVFVKDNGKFISAHGLIPGCKDFPFKVDKGAVQVDGMALEFNINPASNEDEFCINISEVYKELCSMVPKLEVVASPVAHFDPEYMLTVPEKALELGCEPDYNAWSLTMNSPPCGDVPMRTASGHIHVGWGDDLEYTTADHMDICQKLVQQMDFVLGLPSLMFDPDVRRRELYGKAGAFRPKKYGLEYRTLSNAWLTSEAKIRWAYRATRKAVDDFLQGNLFVHKYGDIQNIINTSDIRAAAKIIDKEDIEVAYA